LTNKFGSSAASPTPVALLQSLPDVARLGARVQVSSRTELHVSGEFVHWSVFQRQCAVTIATASAGCQLGTNGQQLPGSGSVPFNLERDWRNTVAVRAGGSYRLRENLALQLGAGYDMHAAPDSTMDAGLGDQDTVSFAAGARYQWSPSLLIAATFSQYVFLDRTVAARSRNAMGQPTTLDLPSRVPDGAGTYSQQISSLNLSAQYSF